MSDVAPARGGSSRGRGSSRGGRGGFRGSRNAVRTKQDNDNPEAPLSAAASASATAASLDDGGEVGELKRKFGDKVPLLREVCPGWSDEDLVYALQETDGAVEEAIDRISSGTISQWGEVKKKHHPKAKDAAPSGDAGTARGRGSRGPTDARGRGRGGSERSTRGARSARAVSHANAHAKNAATKTVDDGWGAVPAADAAAVATLPVNGDKAAEPDGGADADEPKAVLTPAAAALAASSSKKPQPGGWAGHSAPSSAPAAGTDANTRTNASVALPQPPPIEADVVEDSPAELPSAPHSDTGPEFPPPKDDLTSANLEQLPDQSRPLSSQTVASTAASSQHPLAQVQAAKAAVRPVSGYAATALKATSAGAARSASFSRKVLDQQEAVVMPANHAVEKAAVQFGKMGLNGDAELDVDEDREEPETRTQLPDDSPSAPRASLPPPEPTAGAAAPGAAVVPAPASGPVDSQVSPEAHLGQHLAPGLPAPHPPPADSAGGQPAPAYTDSYRYAQPSKSYDPFGQPAAQPHTQPAQSQEPFSNQANQSEYANYYNNRDAYQQYYGSYGHAQDVQRTGSTFTTSGQEAQTQYATARSQQVYPLPDAQDSGNNTPAPSTLTHQTQPQSQALASQGSHAGYPYGYPAAYNQQYAQYGTNYMNQMSAQHQHRYGANRPMFDDARRQDEYYSSQYGYSHNQQFGNSYKSNMYGQPQHQYAYDQHSSSPANVSGFGGRDAYGRSSSTQPSEPQQSVASSHSFAAYGGSGAFGGFGAQQQSAAHQTAAGYVGYGSNAFGSYAGYGGGRGWNH
ncbi:hypothetical protein DV736_g2622, partial [Chaetothyriales sp. CBS 134916]